MMRGPSGFGNATAVVLLALTILVGATPTTAQEAEGTLSITVIDSVDGHRVVQARIVVFGEDSDLRSWSDLEGAARISLAAGSYTVVVSRGGYVNTTIEDVVLQVGSVTAIEVAFPPQSHELNPLQVTVSRQEELANSAAQSVATVGAGIISDFLKRRC